MIKVASGIFVKKSDVVTDPGGWLSSSAEYHDLDPEAIEEIRRSRPGLHHLAELESIPAYLGIAANLHMGLRKGDFSLPGTLIQAGAGGLSVGLQAWKKQRMLQRLGVEQQNSIEPGKWLKLREAYRRKAV